MSAVPEPKRWIDDEQIQPADFSHAYAGHSADAPSAEKRDALWKQLSGRLPAATGGAQVAVSKHSAVWAKYGAMALGATLAAVGWQAINMLQPAPATPRRAAPAVVHEPAAVAELKPVAVEMVQPEAVDELVIEPAPRAERKLHRARGNVTNKAPPQPEPSVASTPDSAQAELMLLLRARRVLESAPQRALALAGEHATSFPNGMLAEERETITIDALRQLGRIDEARRRFQSFSQRFPGSAHRERLADSLRLR